MDSSRRVFLSTGAAAVSSLIPMPLSQCLGTTAGAITPEQFGARGDGISDDTAALARLSQFVNSRGGGEVVFRRATYLVGRQTSSRGRLETYGFDPAAVMEFVGCRFPLTIRGNGARVRCASGLKYGTFDPVTGLPTQRVLPNYDWREIASPYRWMVKVENCSGPVEIVDLELDGNLGGLEVGGPWGDVGRQLPASGLGLYNNSGPERVANLHTHHHALDGIIIDGLDRTRSARSLLAGVRSEYNGRQGCSIVGGNRYDFRNCHFNHTGRAGLASPPSAGVDIEAEGKRVRDLTFVNCEFVDNQGVGLLADQGDSEQASFSGCTFVGAFSWSAWPMKPRFQFNGCRFVGPITNCFGDPRAPVRATRFLECSFVDDRSLSPSGEVFLGQNPSGPIADLPHQPNVTFSQCMFQLTGRHVLPWTTNVVTFADCTMSQRSTATSYPRGTYVGRNRIAGNVDLYSAINRGHLSVNGVDIPRSG